MTLRDFDLRTNGLILLACASLAGCSATASPRDANQAAVEAAAKIAVEDARAAATLHNGPPSNEVNASGPMGFVCWAAILESISETGKRCVANESPTFRIALDKSISEIDSHLKREGGWSDQQLERFKSQMGERTTATEQFCGGEDALRMYKDLQLAGVRELEKTNASMLAMPGPLQWGTCL